MFNIPGFGVQLRPDSAFKIPRITHLWLGQTDEWIAVHLSEDRLDGVYRSRSLGNLTPSVYRLDIRYRWRDINGLGWTDSYRCSFPATPVPAVPLVGSLIGFLLMLVVRWRSLPKSLIR